MNPVALALQAEYDSLLARGGINSLVERCYTPDARLHSFRFRAKSSAEIADVLRRSTQRLSEMGVSQTVLSVSGKDFIWQETLFPDSADGTSVYDFKFLQDGKIRLHLVGDKVGQLWLADGLAGTVPSDQSAAEALHHRYIELEADGDADGLADEFYTPDARVITAKVKIEGEAALRSFFANKFENESGFHLVSIRNLVGDVDYVWFEATAASDTGARTVYDVMLLQDESSHGDSKVTLQLVGVLDGLLPANENG